MTKNSTTCTERAASQTAIGATGRALRFASEGLAGIERELRHRFADFAAHWRSPERWARRQRSRGGELHLIGLDTQLFASFEKDGLLREIGAAIRRDEDRSRNTGKLVNSILVHPPAHPVLVTHSRVA